MWMLSTARAELQFFISPEDVPGGYAILSHVWDENEQSYENVRKIIRECNAWGLNPREYVAPKIRNVCILAETHGFRWIWIDTCCIDKSSSAELSEAINSMFRYYSLSAVCYAFLRDVGGQSNSFNMWEFMQSKWHTRGWTLQELLAPPLVLFVSNSWEVLGSKADFAPHLQGITHIPASVLRMEKPIAKMSIAQRMCWASRRKTTRKEDRAYSLLGIFDINMPTLYGEGERAFRRLQEEILKRHADTTLFAWGQIEMIDATKRGSQALLSRRSTGIFAASPDDFYESPVEFAPAQVRHKDITSSSPDVRICLQFWPGTCTHLHSTMLSPPRSVTMIMFCHSLSRPTGSEPDYRPSSGKEVCTPTSHGHWAASRCSYVWKMSNGHACLIDRHRLYTVSLHMTLVCSRISSAHRKHYIVSFSMLSERYTRCARSPGRIYISGTTSAPCPPRLALRSPVTASLPV